MTDEEKKWNFTIERDDRKIYESGGTYLVIHSFESIY